MSGLAVVLFVNSNGTLSLSFDAADRLLASGSGVGVVDVLGRALSVPQVDSAGSSPLVTGVTYFANDLVATESQTGGVTRTFGLDVLRRLNTWTDTTGIVSTVVTNHYDGMGDSPAWTTSSDGTTTTVRRNILGLDGTLALTATVVGTGTVSASLNIVNPHGDVFTTIPDVVNVTAAQVGACNDADEFGVALTPSAPSYGWVGGKLRATNTATGLIQMGVRVYDPVTGRFLSTDSVYGGNDNSYTYPVDPVNVSDTSGRCPCAVYGWITVEKSYWTPFRYAGSSMTDYLIARGWINDPRVVYLLGYRVGVSVTGMGGQVSVNTSNAATQSYFVSAGGRHMFTLSPYYSLQRWGSQRSIAWSLTVDIEPMTVWEIQPGSGLNVGVSLHVIMRSRYWGVVGYR